MSEQKKISHYVNLLVRIRRIVEGELAKKRIAKKDVPLFERILKIAKEPIPD